MIKIEVKNNSELTIFQESQINGTTQFDFIGSIHFREVNENIFELDGPVARPTFGKELFIATAMYLTSKKCYLALPRDTDSREAVVNCFTHIYNNNSTNKISIPDEYNYEYDEFTTPDDHPVFYEAIQVNPSDEFKKALKIIENNSESDVPNTLLNEWNTFFSIAYESDSNKFIDKDFPLFKNISKSLI